MDIRVSLDGAAGMALLSLPWLLLAVAAWRASRVDGPYRSGADRQGGHSQRSNSGLAYPGLLRAGDAGMAESQALGVMAMSPPGMTLAGTSGSGAHELHFMPDTEAPVLSAREQEEALVSALETAKADRDDGALSRNSVLLARLLIAREARSEAAILLQSAALVARRAKLPVVHAEARIELADLARGEGDMTSACEHWQMAKLMFHETGRRGDQDRMADLMRHNRCPTDWVLTNF